MLQRIPTTPSPSLVILPAAVEDIDQLAEVVAHAFHPPEGVQSLFFPLRKLSISDDIRQRFAHPSSHYCCLAAWMGSRLVGTLDVSLRSIAGLPGRQRSPYISNVAVLPAWQGRGIASQLLRSAEEITQTWGYWMLYLHVMEDNVAARHLYARLHYRILEVNSDPWSWLGFSRQILLAKRMR